MRATALPPGPSAGPFAQTVAFHRDPLDVLRTARDRHGDVFTLRLATARPVVVVAAPAEVGPLLRADPGVATAGSARRAILPLASPASAFGGDGRAHAAARGPIDTLFAPDAVARNRDAMAEIAARHAAAWPRGRPFRLLERDAIVRAGHPAHGSPAAGVAAPRAHGGARNDPRASSERPRGR